LVSIQSYNTPVPGPFSNHSSWPDAAVLGEDLRLPLHGLGLQLSLLSDSVEFPPLGTFQCLSRLANLAIHAIYRPSYARTCCLALQYLSANLFIAGAVAKMKLNLLRHMPIRPRISAMIDEDDSRKKREL
jgi:hypothetical protein